MKRANGPARGFLVPCDPLRRWLRETFPTLTPSALALLIGRDEGIARRWMNSQDYFSDASADLILTRLGHPYMLAQLYPELYVEVDDDLAA